jgi:hypothetical protein
MEKGMTRYPHIKFSEILTNGNILCLDASEDPKPINELSDMTLYTIIVDPASLDKRYTVPEDVLRVAAHIWLERYNKGCFNKKTLRGADKVCQLAGFIITQEYDTLPPPDSPKRGG